LARSPDSSRAGPGDQVVGEQHELEPHLVVFEVAKRQVLKAGLLVVSDVVLHASASAVAALQDRDADRCRSGR
jgi:hypothetical protein